MHVTLDYEILGQGEPLLILHGLFGSKRNWLSIARQLAESVQVIAVDLRNHGNSGHADSMSYSDMAGDLLQLADDLGLGQVSVAGHSMGGKVAMMFALSHPKRTQRVIVLDVAPVRYGSDFSRYIDAMRSVPLDRIHTRQEAETHLGAAVREPALRQFLLHNLVREENAFRWRINLRAIRDNLEELGGFPAIDAAARYEGPAAFLAGAHSDYLAPEHAPEIRRYFPAAELHTIPDAGHWLHADQPAAVLQSVAGFMSRT